MTTPDASLNVALVGENLPVPDETEADYLFSEPLPHFVPHDWSAFLNGTAVEEPDFEPPWLAYLG